MSNTAANSSSQCVKMPNTAAWLLWSAGQLRNAPRTVNAKERKMQKEKNNVQEKAVHSIAILGR